MLMRLATDENADVRYAIAEDVGAPLVILLQLAADENPYVAARALRSLATSAPPQAEAAA